MLMILRRRLAHLRADETQNRADEPTNDCATNSRPYTQPKLWIAPARFPPTSFPGCGRELIAIMERKSERADETRSSTDSRRSLMRCRRTRCSSFNPRSPMAARATNTTFPRAKHRRGLFIAQLLRSSVRDAREVKVERGELSGCAVCSRREDAKWKIFFLFLCASAAWREAISARNRFVSLQGEVFLYLPARNPKSLWQKVPLKC